MKRSYLVYNLYKIKYIEMIWTWKLKVRPWTHLINYLWLIHSTCLILDTRLIRFNWQIPNSKNDLFEISVVDSKATGCFQWDFKWQWQRCWWHGSSTQTVSNIRHQHRCNPSSWTNINSSSSDLCCEFQSFHVKYYSSSYRHMQLISNAYC